MLKITADNYEHYKKVFAVMQDFLWQNLLPGVSPINVLDQWEKQRGMSDARKALKAGLLDCLSCIKLDKSPEEKEKLNQRLLSDSLPGLWELLNIINDVPAKVLKRGKIRNLDEWYVIKELLDDLDSGISDEERDKLGNYFSEFEMKAAKKNNDL